MKYYIFYLLYQMLIDYGHYLHLGSDLIETLSKNKSMKEQRIQ